MTEHRCVVAGRAIWAPGKVKDCKVCRAKRQTPAVKRSAES